MVNRGRPSLDCLPCRRRKLRCDLQRDICGQCRRARLPCGGFRDPKQLVIRDETSATLRKYSRGDQSEKPTVISGPWAGLGQGWEVQARYAFFSHYVYGLSRSYDMLASLYESAPADSYLAASVDAVSLAFVANQENAQGLLPKAGEYYMAAIRRLGPALARPELSSSDATLQAVLLLDLYEKLVNQHPKPSLAWMSHINGAMALVKARGESIMATYVGRRLVTRLVMGLIISCAIAQVRVPNDLIRVRERLGTLLGSRDTKWHVTDLVISIANLAADLREQRVSGDEGVASAKALEGQFEGLEQRLPSAWEFVRVPVVETGCGMPEGVFRDEYRDHYITQVRNTIRTMRLLMIDMIRKREPHADEDAARALVVDSISRDICSTASQMVWPGGATPSAAFTKLQTLQCHTLLAPLYAAGQFCSNEEVRAWVLNTIRYMDEVGGMKRAKQVADTLENSPEVPYWHVYAIIGSYSFAA